MIKINFDRYIKHRCWFGWYWVGYWSYSAVIKDRFTPCFRRPMGWDDWDYKL